MAKRKIGPFELEKQIGAGGMGIVYLATYVKTGQRVAVKVLSPALSANKKLQARFEREMEILKKLRHKNIVQYYGGGFDGTQHFYAMELITGGSLSRLIRKKGRLPWEQAIEVAMAIAKALEHSHNKGVIHRDLKPGNVFLTKDGKIKLGDFGIARDETATALTAAGRTVGTYAYMAPEQIQGKPPISRKTDLYALGCVLFEMLTGRPPFEGETSAATMLQHLEIVPPRVTAYAIDCPIYLENVVLKLMAKDPDDRYFDALAVQVAFSEIGKQVAEQASVAKQTVAGGTASGTVQHDQTELKKLLSKKKKKRKKKVPVYERTWFLAGCLLLLVAVLTWALWPLSEDELFARAEVLMASEESSDWSEARGTYIEPLLERFPEGKHADEAHAFIDRIEMANAERRAMARARRGREPESEAERLFLEAWRFEQFGDRITAMEKYDGMIALLESREEDRPFVNLARRQKQAIGDKGIENNDRVAVVNGSLRTAEEHFSSGQVLPARKVWESIVNLYSSNLELEPQVKFARARLAGREVDSSFLDPPKNIEKNGPDVVPKPSRSE